MALCELFSSGSRVCAQDTWNKGKQYVAIGTRMSVRPSARWRSPPLLHPVHYKAAMEASTLLILLIGRPSNQEHSETRPRSDVGDVRLEFVWTFW